MNIGEQGNVPESVGCLESGLIHGNETRACVDVLMTTDGEVSKK